MRDFTVGDEIICNLWYLGSITTGFILKGLEGGNVSNQNFLVSLRVGGQVEERIVFLDEIVGLSTELSKALYE